MLRRVDCRIQPMGFNFVTRRQQLRFAVSQQLTQAGVDQSPTPGLQINNLHGCLVLVECGRELVFALFQLLLYL